MKKLGSFLSSITAPVRSYFTPFETVLFLVSFCVVTVPFFIFDGTGFMNLAASLVGLIMLIFNAKGNPLGQFFAIIFSILYAVISYDMKYFGEMITYLCMTMPMAVFSLIAWLAHPFKDKKSEVEIGKVDAKEMAFMLLIDAVVTTIFYFILDYFGTANILPSTFSVTTSFAAVYLTMRRSEYFALAYAANDIVLLVLWSLAAFTDISYISVIACFVAFLANDIYTFVSWQKIKKRQSTTHSNEKSMLINEDKNA